jgi:hypothetical protein
MAYPIDARLLETTKRASPPRHDLTGKRFGRLVVIEDIGHRGGVYYWRCRCDCGTERITRGNSLTIGRTKSCGCLHRELLAITKRRHGHYKSPTYGVWLAMKQRCNDPKQKGYKNYGGRGVTVCAQWNARDGFAAFFEHVGERPSPKHTLDRIDNERGYEPGNVRWVTRAAQSRNTRRNVLITFNGETKVLMDWARHFGIKITTLQGRLRLGWDFFRAVTTPVKHRRSV